MNVFGRWLRVVDSLDGDRSTVSISKLDRRTRVRLIEAGQTDVVTPQRAAQAFLSMLKASKGSTAATAKPLVAEGIRHPALSPIRPGQIVAVDATRADTSSTTLTGRACSVEILTAIDVATRVVWHCVSFPKVRKWTRCGTADL